MTDQHRDYHREIADERDMLRADNERLARERNDCREDYVREKTISNGYAASLIAAERQIETLREALRKVCNISHAEGDAAGICGIVEAALANVPPK